MPPKKIRLRNAAGAAALAAALAALSPAACRPREGGDAAGREVRPGDSFQPIVTALMAKWGLPGGAVGVLRDGRLAYAEGYGFADRERRRPATPATLFRIASLSKPITAVAVLKLVEQGRLRLDDKPFKLLDDLKPPAGAFLDPRLYDITVRDLLQHSGGFDRTASGDPMFKPTEIAWAMGAPPPADPATIIRYVFTQPLDFPPGARIAYSNFGYSVLGRVIERVTGGRYRDFVREKVLAPMGIRDMRLGLTEAKFRAPGEARYYDFPNAWLTASIFPFVRDPVAMPEGGFHLEAMDAHGGWLASAADMMRFMAWVDGRSRHRGFLRPATLALMTARPPIAEYRDAPAYYALGWMVRPAAGAPGPDLPGALKPAGRAAAGGGDGEADWWHTGSLSGSTSILVRAHNGLAWVALFNSQPADADGFLAELDRALWKAAEAVTSWPRRNLFNKYR